MTKQQQHLSASDQLDLVARFQRGESDVIATLVETNKPFVVTMAKKFTAKHLSLDELTHFGMAGIVHAAHKFDFNKGTNFLTYARHYIYSQIQQGIVTSTPCTITIPRQVYDSIIKIKNLTLEGYSDEEISKKLDIKEDKIPKLRGIEKEESMSNVIGSSESGDEAFLEDILPCNKNSIEAYFDDDVLDSVIDFLDSQGRVEKIVYCHYNGLFGYERMTYKDLSEVVGRSIGTIMKIEKDITKRLIEKFRGELIEENVG